MGLVYNVLGCDLAERKVVSTKKRQNMSIESDSLLTSSPNIRHGQPCISGTGISVRRIAVLHNLGHSTEDVVRKYEHLTPAGVHAALAYYFANKQRIDSEIAAGEDEVEKIEKEFLDRQQVA
jgi:uncharacterized protein (DUF433 family)